VKVLGRTDGEQCGDCGHSRGMHNLQGELGICGRIGCPCDGYLELLHTHQIHSMPGEQVVVTLARRHRHHRGWHDDVG